ncbi:unnamed protein product [Closterium sp. NIES-53]
MWSPRLTRKDLPVLRLHSDTGVFRVWGSRAFVHDTSADKLSARTIHCVFLGFVPNALGWQFYHPTSRCVFPSQDVTFDESVPFYHPSPYRSAPPPPSPLFLAPGPPPVDPLPPQGPAPSGVSQVDPLPGSAPIEVAVGSGAARGGASGGAASGGAEPGGAESEGAGSGGAELGGEEPGGAEPEGVEPKGAESKGAESGGAEPRGAALSGGPPATGAGGAGDAGAGGTGVTAGAGGTRGVEAAGPGGARTKAAGAGGSGAGGAGAGGAESGGTGAGGAGAGGAGVGGTSARGAGAEGAGAVDPGGSVRSRSYFVPLLEQVLGVPSSTSLTPPLLCPSPDQSQPPLLPASPLPAPSPYTEQSGGLTERHEPPSRPVLPVRPARRIPRSRPPPVLGTHSMALPTATAAPESCATMASLRVLPFDPDGRPVAFDTWYDDLQLYLLSDLKDSVSLFDHVSSGVPAPPATADASTRSQWLSRDATARLAIRNHLPATKCAHFGEHRTTQALYDAVVARYSSPATTAIGRLLLPYLFPELSTFALVADLVTHLRTSNARYRATVPAEDHFLTLDPTSLTVDLLEQHLLAAETSAVAVGAARGTPRSPFFEGCSPSPLSSSFASAAAADVSVPEDVGAASSSTKRHNSKSKGGRGSGGGSGGGGGGSGSGSGGSGRGGGGGGGGGSGGPGGGGGGSGGDDGGSGGSGGNGGGGTSGGWSGPQRGGLGGGRGQQQQRRSETQTPQQLREFHTERHCFARLDDAWRTEFGDDVERPRWAELLRSGVAIFDLDFDVIIFAMHALSSSAEGDCYWCVPPDPGIAAAALGASASGTPPGTAPAEALHTFTLDSDASCCFFRDSTTLTPLPAPVPVRLADPSGGPVVASSSTVLPCPAVPSGSLSGLHLPSFSTNLVSTAALQDAMVTTTTPGGSSLYTLATEPPQTLLWHHRLGHPSLPCLRGMHSHLLVSGLPRSLPPLPPSPAPPSLPCVEGRQRAAPHSSSFPPTTAPLQTLHMDVWGPARVSGQGRERNFLLVVDDYTRYTTVFPLRNKGEVSTVLIPWIRTRRIGLVMEVARTSMIHAAAPHFLWPFAVRYAAHQLNLWPHVSLPETLPTLRWTGKVGDASVFQVWGSRAFVGDTSADKLSTRAIPCVFLGFVPDAPGWQFYHPTSRRVLPSQDVTFDESVPFYRLFPYGSAPSPPPPLFLAPDPPTVDPLPPQGPAPSGVSQVDPLPGTAPVQVAVVSSAAPSAAPSAASGGAASRGAEPGGAGSEGVGSWGAEPEGVEPGGAEAEGTEPGGAESEGAESGGAEPRGAASSGGPAGASPRLSSQQLREWLVQRAHSRSGARGAGEPRDTGAVGAVVTTGAGDPTEPGAAGAEGAGAGVAGVGGPGAGGTGAAGAGVVDPGARGAGGTVRPRPYFVPLLQQVLCVPSSTGLPPPFLCPPPDQSQPPLEPASPLPVPSPYNEQSGGLTKCREPASRPVSPVRTARRAPRSRPPPVQGTHTMALRPSSVPRRVPLPAHPESSLLEVPDPESDRARAASPTVARVFATAVIYPSFESAAASALVAELLDFAVAYRLDYACGLVAESMHASPPSVGGECALGTDVLEDRQEDFECLAAAVPRFASLLLAPEGDPDAPDIPTPRSHAEAITGPYSSQWEAAMDAEMASLNSIGTYVNEVPPPGVNIVDGMWIFRVKRPPGSPPAFKARYVARGFSQRQGVDYFHTFSPTPKMTTLRVFLHVAAQRGYELHSLDFSTAFLQGSLHEEIWLRRPLGFTGSFPTVCVDDLVFATADTEALTLGKSELQKIHTCSDLGELRSYLGLQITRDRTRRTIILTLSQMVHQVLQRFGFQYSSPQLTPLSTSHMLSAPPLDESVEPSGPYPELVGCLMYLMTSTRPDLAYPLSLLARYVAPVVLTGHADASWVDDSATQRSSQGYTFSLGSGSALDGATLAHLLLTDLGEQPRSPLVLYVDNKAMIALCQEHRLEHRTKHIALRYFLAR